MDASKTNGQITVGTSGEVPEGDATLGQATVQRHGLARRHNRNAGFTVAPADRLAPAEGDSRQVRCWKERQRTKRAPAWLR